MVRADLTSELALETPRLAQESGRTCFSARSLITGGMHVTSSGLAQSGLTSPASRLMSFTRPRGGRRDIRRGLRNDDSETFHYLAHSGVRQWDYLFRTRAERVRVVQCREHRASYLHEAIQNTWRWVSLAALAESRPVLPANDLGLCDLGTSPWMQAMVSDGRGLSRC